MRAGAYAKAPPYTGSSTAPIPEKSTKKRKTECQGPKMRDVARHEDTLARMMSHIGAARRKADKTLISEIPTNRRLKKYMDEMKEEGYASRGGISRIASICFRRAINYTIITASS